MRSSTTGKMPRSSSDRSAPSGKTERWFEARFPSTRLGLQSHTSFTGCEGILLAEVCGTWPRGLVAPRRRRAQIRRRLISHSW